MYLLIQQRLFLDKPLVKSSKQFVGKVITLVDAAEEHVWSFPKLLKQPAVFSQQMSFYLRGHIKQY